MEYVSKLMGHASIKHTEVYARALNHELDLAMDVFDKDKTLKRLFRECFAYVVKKACR